MNRELTHDEVTAYMRKKCIEKCHLPKDIKNKYDFVIKNGKLILTKK